MTTDQLLRRIEIALGVKAPAHVILRVKRLKNGHVRFAFGTSVLWTPTIRQALEEADEVGFTSYLEEKDQE